MWYICVNLLRLTRDKLLHQVQVTTAKVKCCPCPCHEGMWWDINIAQPILNFVTRCRREVSLMPSAPFPLERIQLFLE